MEAINHGLVSKGRLNMLEYHMVFVEKIDNDKTAAGRPPRPRESFTPYPLVRQATFRPTSSSSGIKSSIRLQTRDFTFITFNFGTESDAREAFELLRAHSSQVASVDKLYAFAYKPLRQEREHNGWEIYSPRAEYRRQGISDKLPDRGWRMSTINKGYNFSATYPELIVVPSSISDNVLKYAGAHRSRSRIPALSYLHPVNNCSITRSSQPMTGITRKRSLQDERLVAACFSATHLAPSASQVEISSYSESDISDVERSEDDFVTAGNACFDEKTGKRLVYGAQQNNLIVDARPTINAAAMQLVGKGSENMDFYKCAKKAYLYIANIHVMRKSLDIVFKALQDSDVAPLAVNRDLLNSSGWMDHIAGILDGAALIARQVGVNHSHVLIHCSDGWDRTSQLSALAQVVLDPYYRTYEGFMVLVEKEWLGFGHKFQQRSGPLGHEDWHKVQSDAMAGTPIQPGEGESQGDGDRLLRNVVSSTKRFFNKHQAYPDEITSEDDMESTSSSKPLGNGKPQTDLSQLSPVFHQFLEATQQMVRQFPDRFEFNERFLRRLFYHSYSCQYGTFLFDSEKERKEAHVAERTRSVWDYFLSKRDMFTNKNFDPTVDDKIRGKERLLFPKIKGLRWWYQLYGRTDEEMSGTTTSVAHKDAIAAGREFQELMGERALSDTPDATRSSDVDASSQEFLKVDRFQNQPAQQQATDLGGTVDSKTSISTIDMASDAPEPQKVATASASISPPRQRSISANVEAAHGALTPEVRQPTISKSGSAQAVDALTTIRDQLGHLSVGGRLMEGISALSQQASARNSDGAGSTFMAVSHAGGAKDKNGNRNQVQSLSRKDGARIKDQEMISMGSSS